MRRAGHAHAGGWTALLFKSRSKPAPHFRLTVFADEWLPVVDKWPDALDLLEYEQFLSPKAAAREVAEYRDSPIDARGEPTWPA